MPANGAGFETRLFRNLVHANRGRNVFLSPFSIASTLAMVQEGAGGATRLAIERTLGSRGPNAVWLPPTRRDPGIEMRVANALWAEKSIRFAPAFVRSVRTRFAAEARAIDLHGPSGVPTINDWVARATADRIKDLFRPGDLSAADAVLTNAVYFKGRWTEAFTKSATRSAPFRTPRGETAVPMMSRGGEIGYRRGVGFQAVRLPFGDASSGIAFYVYLPDTADGLTKLVDRGGGVDWGWNRFVPSDLRLFLPRFQVRTEYELVRPLSELGMAIAFQPGADFRPMGLGGDFIGRVRHKAFMAVDEAGTEAAAATGVVMTKGAPIVRERPIVVRVDRPFLCAIRDERTATLLFVGAIFDPAAPK